MVSYILQETHQNFNSITAPLTDPLKKQVKITWGLEQERAFGLSKDKLTTILVLAIPDFSKIFEIECDAYARAVGGLVLYYLKKGGQLNL